MAFITVGNVQMFYEDLGKPDGLPIIMLHGSLAPVALTGSTRSTFSVPAFA